MATVTSAARESGDDNILYSMSDGSTILLDGQNPAAVDNNPGDLTGNYFDMSFCGRGRVINFKDRL